LIIGIILISLEEEILMKKIISMNANTFIIDSANDISKTIKFLKDIWML